MKIVCIRSDSVLKSRLFFVLQSAVTSVTATRLNKRLLFEICVVVAYFISFKPVLAAYRGNEMSLFCYITRSFSYRRNDVSFVLQLIWGDAIFVKVVAVSFSSSILCLVPHPALLTIYKTNILPVFDYGSIIYDNCSDYDNRMLDKAPLSAAKIILGLF